MRRLRTAKGNRALLIGAGGTAKAAIYALSKVALYPINLYIYIYIYMCVYIYIYIYIYIKPLRGRHRQGRHLRPLQGSLIPFLNHT